MAELLLILLLLVALVHLFISVKKKNKFDLQPQFKVLEETITKRLDAMLESTEKLIKDEFQRNRSESSDLAIAHRKELSEAFEGFGRRFGAHVKTLHELLQNRQEEMRTAQTDFNRQTAESHKKHSEALTQALQSFEQQFKHYTKELHEGLRQKFSDFSRQQQDINKQTTDRVKDLRHAVEGQMKDIREDNSKQLGEMRKTVDEKLQKTLNERLSQSFDTVGKQLQAVQEGLGEMRNLATDVGGLKKVLSNVKMRGGIGEIQLSMLLEQVLAPEQYAPNVKTKAGSADLVEFAIKLPGRGDTDTPVWLPVDAKFNKEAYERLQEAHEEGNTDKVAQAQKSLEQAIRKNAKDISEKYLDPPHTTDFGIMFLPFEGIYAEVVRKAALLEELQRDYKIIVTGPTTLYAILNSLQMGFKTLAIQKRSSEVWQILGAVKTEFSKFGGMMQKAQKNIQTGLGQLEEVMGTRTRAIERKLRSVEGLNEADTQNILPEIALEVSPKASESSGQINP